MKVTSAWKPFRIDEQTKGSKTQTQFRGFRTRVSVVPTEENAKVLESLQRFNSTLQQYDVNVIRVDDQPIAKSGFAASNPSEWYDDCRNGGAALPKPSYGMFLGLPSVPKCIANCVQRGNCPEIILIDTKVNRHPDILRALGQRASSSLVDMCPYTRWNDKYHGTHLAGIMVSSAQSSSFPGLGSTASLQSESNEMTAEQLRTLIQNKGFTYTTNAIFVFASRFMPVEDDGRPLANSNQRHVTPYYVPEIKAGNKLWVVAAGNGPKGKDGKQQDGVDISDTSRLSPMNLGDLPNVLVVTACEECLTDSASLSSWANYSTHELVNVAAPGGTPEHLIPAPATETHYSASHGTSQATALVGGLAAAMSSCYPQEYADSTRLKLRIQETARPPLNDDVGKKSWQDS